MFRRRKYRLLINKQKHINGHTLYQVKYLKSFVTSNGDTITKGTCGGYIESYSNLSQEGSACVIGNACIYGDSKITGSTEVSCGAHIVDSECFNSFISGLALVENSNVRISKISDFAEVSECNIDKSVVEGESYIVGANLYNCYIFDHAQIKSNKYDDIPAWKLNRNEKTFNNCVIGGDIEIVKSTECINIQACPFFDMVTITFNGIYDDIIVHSLRNDDKNTRLFCGDTKEFMSTYNNNENHNIPSVLSGVMVIILRMIDSAATMLRYNVEMEAQCKADDTLVCDIQSVLKYSDMPMDDKLSKISFIIEEYNKERNNDINYEEGNSDE